MSDEQRSGRGWTGAGTPGYFAAVAQLGWIGAPQGALWGAAAVGLGFAILLASLGASWALQRGIAGVVAASWPARREESTPGGSQS